MKYLVGDPQSVTFLDNALLDTGLNAMLGELEKNDAAVAPDIQSARVHLRDAVKKVAALGGDPTRTEVERHAAAKKLADAVGDKLAKTKAAIEERASYVQTTTLQQAHFALGPKSERGSLQSEIRSWVRDLAKKSDGLPTIREALATNDDLAAVLWHSPRFLLGLPESTHEMLRFEALESRKPDLYAALSTSARLEKLAEKYAAAIRRVQTSFYNPATASVASRRVEV